MIREQQSWKEELKTNENVQLTQHLQLSGLQERHFVFAFQHVVRTLAEELGLVVETGGDEDQGGGGAVGAVVHELGVLHRRLLDRLTAIEPADRGARPGAVYRAG